jgi:biopolymer transport protein ExbB/TolQ
MSITEVAHTDTVLPRHQRANLGIDAIAIGSPADLDVRLTFSVLAGAVLTGVTIVMLQPYRGTLWGKIILERGATQYLSIFLTFCVLGFVLGKMVRLSSAAKRRQFDEIPDVSHLSPVELLALRDRMAAAGDALSLFRARALQAFMVSRKRSAAVVQLQEDTSLAHGHIEQAYAIPRVMIWAIPLMGFIGTVVGISSAVAGFTGFLQGAEEIEQVRGAIGNVTTGLAVAFDTTLVALVLSVIAMLAVSITERLETRRLLAMESDVNQTILAGLPEGGDLDSRALRNEVAPLLDSHAIALEASLREVIRESLPKPEEMVLPAQVFLRDAAGEIASSPARVLPKSPTRFASFISSTTTYFHGYRPSRTATLRRRPGAITRAQKSCAKWRPRSSPQPERCSKNCTGHPSGRRRPSSHLRPPLAVGWSGSPRLWSSDWRN